MGLRGGMEGNVFLHCTSLNCLNLLITMKIFDKGNTATKYRHNIGLLASVETFTPRLSHLPAHGHVPTMARHPIILSTASPRAALHKTLGLPGLGNSSLSLAHSIPSPQGLLPLTVMFDRLFHHKILKPGRMPEFPAPRKRLLELDAYSTI